MLSTWITKGQLPLANKRPISEEWRKFNYKDVEDQFNYSKCPIYKKFRFYVEGLQCSSCVHLLEDFPRYFPNVVNSKLNFGQRILEVQTNLDVHLGELCGAIALLGYKPTPLNEETSDEQARRDEQRNELKRIGVAGAVAGNAMLFAVPLYAGLSGNLAVVFKWILFTTFLPVLFYSAMPFYKKAWGSLLARRINVDMMITVALWAGFVFSTYSLLKGSDDLYFDSTASFIFLILLTRYFLRQHQDKLLRKNIFEDLFLNEAYEVANQPSTFAGFKSIQPGQTIILKRNQLLPCDSELLSEQSAFDLAFLTGEAFPQIRHRGDKILAGSRLLSQAAEISCLTSSLKSHLAQALGSLDIRKTENKIQSMSDLIAHRLTLAVFSIAIIFFALTYDSLGFEAFKRCLALITIACPCAVAFGTPLAFSIGLKKAAGRGFFVRSEDVFEKLSQVKKVVFDKTGTLTSSQLKMIKSLPEEIDELNRSIILGLEKSSLHPLALGLQEAWSQTPIADVKNVSEKIGEGVAAQFNESTYQLKKSIEDPGHGAVQVDYTVDGKRTAYLFFEEKLRPEAADVVNEFYKIGFDILMLTGDKRPRAIAVSKKLAIRPNHVFSDQSAESKKVIIEKQNPCLFVGDGLNDLKALRAAYVSFAIKGSFESTFQVSDIYAPKKDLRALLEIISLSNKIQNTVKANLLFAVFYNTVGGLLALGGYINPLAAAVLMPISSFLITAHTVWRLR